MTEKRKFFLTVAATYMAAGGAMAAIHVSHPHRSQAAVDHFKHAWSEAHGGLPCPEEFATYVKRDGKFVEYERCGAGAVDHVCALACGGADDPSNMQWLEKYANIAKSDDCSLCDAR